MASCFQCDGRFTLLTVLVRGRSNIKGTSSIFMISSGPMEFSAIFVWVYLQKFVTFPRSREGFADTESSVRWWTGLFILINLRHHNGPPLKSSIFFSVVIALAISQICTVETPRPSALCVFAQSSRTFSSSGHLLSLPLKAFVVYLHQVSSSHCRLQCLTIDSLMPNSHAAALFPSSTAGSIAFNLKAASHVFLCVFSMMRVCLWCAKGLFKTQSNECLPQRIISSTCLSHSCTSS